jgi:hypothetical protein
MQIGEKDDQVRLFFSKPLAFCMGVWVDRFTISSANTGCPKSPDAVLRGYISGTPRTTEMGWVPKDASYP